ncbi:MAG: periplasmic heavy metal sensor [Pseudomonadota bacterium]
MSDSQTRRFPVVLTLSLVVNGLLAGLLIGSGLRQERTPPPPDGGERALVRALEASVTEADRSSVRDALRIAYAATRAERLELRQARRDLRRALAADPYNVDDVVEAFQAVRSAEATARVGLHNELARQFERLSADERASALRFMDHPRRRDFRDRRFRPNERQPTDTEN